MRWLAILGLGAASCTFHPAPGLSGDGDGGGGGSGSGDRDGGVTDVGTDTELPTSAAMCRAMGAPTNAGLIGGTSGNMRTPELCGPDELVVSFTFDMTNGLDWNNRIAVSRATMSCAKIARRAGETFQNTPGRTYTANADPCNPFEDPVQTAPTTCPAGSVVVGLRAATIPSPSGPDTCFSNLTVLCAAIGADGKPGALTSTLPIDGTFNQGLNDRDVICPAGQALRGVRPYDGCGVDGLQLLCSPVLCD